MKRLEYIKAANFARKRSSTHQSSSSFSSPTSRQPQSLQHQFGHCVWRHSSTSTSSHYTGAMSAQQIVVQSNPKWQFLMALGLDGHNREHQALYWIMKVCVEDFFDRGKLTTDRAKRSGCTMPSLWATVTPSSRNSQGSLRPSQQTSSLRRHSTMQ